MDANDIALFAIKFFASRRDYAEEVEVYRNSPLRTFMPRVLHFESNENSRIRDPFGGHMPPFIVMEKGESLQERARNCRVDVFTAAQVHCDLSTPCIQIGACKSQAVSFC
jgi:hypothetical protein